MATNFWGNTLRELRMAQGVSERQLAAVTKVNRSTLRRIEQGIARPDIMLMERLFDYLGYEIEVLHKQSPAQLAKHHLDDASPAYRSATAASRLLKLSTSDLK